MADEKVKAQFLVFYNLKVGWKFDSWKSGFYDSTLLCCDRRGLCCHGCFFGRKALMGRVVYVMSCAGFWKVVFAILLVTIGNYLGCLMPAIAEQRGVFGQLQTGQIAQTSLLALIAMRQTCASRKYCLI
jgi:uncharacterized membrane protein